MKLVNVQVIKDELERLIRNYRFYSSTEAKYRYEAYKELSEWLDGLEVKKVDLNNGIQLTWEDIRELYIIFAEVDVDIELCKTADIQAETIGYYQEVLKRFKAQKEE